MLDELCLLVQKSVYMVIMRKAPLYVHFSCPTVVGTTSNFLVDTVLYGPYRRHHHYDRRRRRRRFRLLLALAFVSSTYLFHFFGNLILASKQACAKTAFTCVQNNLLILATDWIGLSRTKQRRSKQITHHGNVRHEIIARYD